GRRRRARRAAHGRPPRADRRPQRDRERREVNHRRKAREIALAFLYQWDVRGDEVLPELDDLLVKDRREPDVAEYVKILVRGTIENREAIDKRISDAAEHWRSERMAVVDRDLLRVGTAALASPTYAAPPRAASN